MSEVYLLSAKSGLDNWYGWNPNEVKKLLMKNLFFFERAYEVSAFHLEFKKGEFRLMLEGCPAQIQRLSRRLICQMNRQLQHDSRGIFIFSGGLSLRRILLNKAKIG